MSFYTIIEVEVSLEVVKALIVSTIHARRQIQGNLFATADETESLLEDPFAHLHLVRGQIETMGKGRFNPARIVLKDWSIGRRSLCLEYRVESQHILQLGQQFAEALLPAAIKEVKMTKKTNGETQIRQGLTKAICASVKATLNIPSENRLGRLDEENLSNLVQQVWDNARKLGLFA